MAALWLIVALLPGCVHQATVPAQDEEAAPETPREGTGELVFTPHYPESAHNPAFSTDGNTVLFTPFHGGCNDGPAGLYLLGPESRSASELLDEADCGSVNLPGSCWNAATGRIVFSSDRGRPMAGGPSSRLVHCGDEESSTAIMRVRVPEFLHTP